jgi:flagellar basal body-associated protein FliL
MSGKYERKNKKSGKPFWLILLAAVLLFAAVAAGVIFLTGEDLPEEPVQPSTTPAETDQIPQESEEAAVPEETEEEPYLLAVDPGIRILEIGSYTGAYMEDGSDDAVENILQITVKNMGTEPLQYSKFRLISDSGEEALFEMTTLFPGEKMTVLEANRKTFDETVEYSSVYARLRKHGSEDEAEAKTDKELEEQAHEDEILSRLIKKDEPKESSIVDDDE